MSRLFIRVDFVGTDNVHVRKKVGMIYCNRHMRTGDVSESRVWNYATCTWSLFNSDYGKINFKELVEV